MARAMKPIDLPPPDSFAHGTRSRYVSARCRCARCRRANREYGRAREGQPYNGLVSTLPARKHLQKLARQGVGRRAVADASDVALSIVRAIGQGRKPWCRASTRDALLEITTQARADGALVNATSTRRLLGLLLEEGFTKKRLAALLGSRAKTPALQITAKKITAKNALKVKRLYRRLMGEAEGRENRPRAGRPSAASRLDSSVRERIRTLHRDGVAQREIAARLQISPTTVGKILRGH
jgi:hypothetical protein